MNRLELPEVSVSHTMAPHPMSEAEFLAWQDEDIRAEWVNGEVIVISPASTKHVDLVGFLNLLLRLFTTSRQLGVVYGPELQVHFEELRRWRIPDLLFVAADRLQIIKPTYVEGAPDLVIEIVSPDSLARDWREKYLEYEAAGVREYWVIDPMSERVEAYTLNERSYTLIQEREDKTLPSIILPDFYLNPAWLWQDPLPNPLEILKELAVL